MPPTPTIQNSIDKRPSRSMGGSGERRSELVSRVKFGNTLPDLPFDPKFITYPFSSNRFVEYSTTSLEKNYKYEVLTEIDLGVDVELVIPNFYDPPKNTNPLVHSKDEKLLEDDNLFQKNQKRSRHHAKSVSWLRRTEYISTEQTRFQPQTIDKVEAKVGYSIKKTLKEDIHYMDKDTQIKNIEKTFVDAQKDIESNPKPGVYPLEILPVFPDFKLWKYPCAQVIFDSDPSSVTMQDKSLSDQLDVMSEAMIRGVMDESGEQFVAYFLPTEETLQKRRRDIEDGDEYKDEEVYEYKMAREYNWNVKTKATKGYEETYFFVMRDNGVYYDELETRVRLNKRRTRGPNQQLNTKLCVKHIPLSASDYKFQAQRERQLEPLMEEGEEEEDKSDAEHSVKSDNEDKKSDKGSGDERKAKKSDAEESDKSDDEDKKSDAGGKSDSDKSDKHSGGSRASSPKSRSRSRSRSRSKSRSRSRSKSRSRSRSRSGSGSGSSSSSGEESS